MAATDPEHSSLRPFTELPPDVQRQDAPLAEAIQRVSRELGLDATADQGMALSAR